MARGDGPWFGDFKVAAHLVLQRNTGRQCRCPVACHSLRCLFAGVSAAGFLHSCRRDRNLSCYGFWGAHCLKVVERVGGYLLLIGSEDCVYF